VTPLRRWLPWVAGALLAPFLLAALFIAVFGWNWLRGPIERMTLERTGRALAIGGDINVSFSWPVPQLHAGAVSFANPPWAREKQMVSAEAVQVAIDLPQLLLRRIVLPEVRLRRPVVFLEQGSGGRKNWLLDLRQQDEEARVRIDRLMLDEGRLGYDDVAQKTSIRAELSTPSQPAGLRFSAQGRFKGLPLKASGSGGPVLGLRDEHMPYPLQAELSVGGTAVKADGSITSLLKFSAVDMRLALRGDSLAQLYPLLGIAFPETRAYSTEGHMQHSGTSWRYEKFSARFGESDVAGLFEVHTGGKRPAIKADLVAKVLDIADLGAVIGSRPGILSQARQSAVQAGATPAAAPAPQTAPALAVAGRLLPTMRFDSERWDSVDAQVTLQANALRGVKAFTLDDFKVHLSLRDSVLTLDPLDFGLAGGQLNAAVSLDGRKNPIQARAQVSVRRIPMARLFPEVAVDGIGKGQFNGDLALAGNGNTVARMLAGSSGKLRLVVDGGEISQLMMEKAGLHLWEILQLSLSGDRLIRLRCGVADFSARDGVLTANMLILDTEVTTLFGKGSVDLRKETLDLTLNPKTKNTSVVALRSPIYIRGSFANPSVGVDKARVAVRALGALGLGLANPLLALAPLIDAGPGSESDCANLLRSPAVAQAPAKKKTSLRK
jgi:uncharacterized protein involved in outer membrane biogenesis